MRFIKPSYKILTSNKYIESKEELLNEIYKSIEYAGRLCYASHCDMFDGSAKSFVDKMIKSKHFAMLEHGNVYFKTENVVFGKKYSQNKYSKVVYEEGKYFISTNYRIIVENGWESDIEFICSPDLYHDKRISVHFTTDIGVTRELNRHRVNSIAEQSTRYCRYDRDRFGSEIKYVMPEWTTYNDYSNINDLEYYLHNVLSGEDESKFSAIDYYFGALLFAEFSYMKLIEKGWTAEMARQVLNMNTASEIVHTAYYSDWRHFIDLRVDGSTGRPHPNMTILCLGLRGKLSELKD